jgi:hypothetical protein
MLFDLRGRGRRRTVQVIYLSLALLMGGGLVLFGIGSSSDGGIVDAVMGDGSSGDSPTKTIDKQIASALAKTRATPKDPAVWSSLAKLRYQRASLDGFAADDVTYTDKGKAKLAHAADAWERHLALDPKKPDVNTARLMVQAYGASALNEPVKAVRAMEVVTAAEDPPNSNLFAQLALLAYTAKEERTGDLAAARAIDLAPKSDRKLLKTTIDQRKAQIEAQAAQATATTTTPAG